MEKTKSQESRRSEPTGKDTASTSDDKTSHDKPSIGVSVGDASNNAANADNKDSTSADDEPVEELTGDEPLECAWEISWDQGANKANKQGNNYCSCLQSLGTFRTVGEFVECWE